MKGNHSIIKMTEDQREARGKGLGGGGSKKESGSKVRGRSGGYEYEGLLHVAGCADTCCCCGTDGGLAAV